MLYVKNCAALYPFGEKSARSIGIDFTKYADKKLMDKGI